MPPTILYLDSSAYSNLATADQQGNEALTDQVERLNELISRGVLEIRYSGVTILECAHTSLDHVEYGVARAQAIENLCRSRTISWPYELWRRELDQLSDNKPQLERTQVIRDHNIWMPKFHLSRRELVSGLEEKAREEFSELPRNQRRLMLRRLFKRDRLSQEFLDRLSSGGIGITEQMLREFPLLSGVPADELFSDFLLGKTSEDEFTREFAATFLQPENFVRYFYDRYRSEPDAADDILRQQGEKFVQFAKMARAEMEKVRQVYIDNDIPESSFRQKLKTHRPEFHDWRRNVISALNSKNLSPEALEDLADSEFGSFPSLDMYVETTCRFIAEKIKDQKSKLSPSDNADLLHAQYAPYVDIIHVDKRMHRMVQDVARAMGLKTVVVASTEAAVEACNDLSLHG